MELGLRLSQKQTLKLVMTPRLQQALKLLQMPSLELSAHIEQELLTNPLLELDEETPDPSAEAERSDSDETTPPDETELQSEESPVDWSEYFDDGFEYADGGRNEREETEFYEKVPVGRATLSENLTEQLHLLDLDEETLRIAEYLLGCLDDSGFLVIPLEEVADELGVDVEEALVALCKVQELEPAGVGARNLPESLLIQLGQTDRGDSLAARIVKDHFDGFMRKQYQEIARALKVKAEDIQEAAHEIATLNPRPGAQLALEDARYVVPDLVVAEVDGQYVVSLADGSVPRLRVSRKYREILQRDARPDKPEPPPAAPPAAGAEPAANGTAESAGTAAEDGKAARATRREEEVKFVQDKLKSASWLIQTIEQRRRTMIKVMEAIVEAQHEFFERGPEALRPLTLQDVAEKIGMHESTVSRVTTNKYVQTPRGVLPLKHFFSSSLDTESGQTVSSKMAMSRIKELISREDKKKPLSDQKIAELLRKEGLIVARRTVAKYRERMDILSARYRKEF
ncbi:MAG TPA: RNA polymerase sigma-54 factor [bacterium]|nr:RNA polymerase sigma-54 factor [bacterium]